MVLLLIHTDRRKDFYDRRLIKIFISGDFAPRVVPTHAEVQNQLIHLFLLIT